MLPLGLAVTQSRDRTRVNEIIRLIRMLMRSHDASVDHLWQQCCLGRRRMKRIMKYWLALNRTLIFKERELQWVKPSTAKFLLECLEASHNVQKSQGQKRNFVRPLGRKGQKRKVMDRWAAERHKELNAWSSREHVLQKHKFYLQETQLNGTGFTFNRAASLQLVQSKIDEQQMLEPLQRNDSELLILEQLPSKAKATRHNTLFSSFFLCNLIMKISKCEESFIKLRTARCQSRLPLRCRSSRNVNQRNEKNRDQNFIQARRNLLYHVISRHLVPISAAID